MAFGFRRRQQTPTNYDKSSTLGPKLAERILCFKYRDSLSILLYAHARSRELESCSSYSYSYSSRHALQSSAPIVCFKQRALSKGAKISPFFLRASEPKTGLNGRCLLPSASASARKAAWFQRWLAGNYNQPELLQPCTAALAGRMRAKTQRKPLLGSARVSFS